ncbi:Pectate lyase superfamily protein [Paenibacillus sp. cl141a]|uniref:glycosyl hydrolase family 28-related protein n=1 Tax=Paenibacillus sp. cl141a TaxID=1761877 RepID=UPI0008B85D74|nr:glycosyl hydrolase family 28-related protein [Paenibacillus sp. cl141a]SEK76039.1 Pectate lyase superfamily protein [Paenibacillus sp. cl141a]
MPVLNSQANVKNFGAKGDGVSDDTIAFQQAIQACASGAYSVIYMPKGRYRITQTLVLPKQERPNTNATQGIGLTIYGDGMYDSGIIYTGTDYALYSDKDMAETILFRDFYINHAAGGGIYLPQGAHQMFERFFSSACGEGKFGVYIQGMRSGTNPTSGYGGYMISFRDCRFWQETGYLGTGLKLEDIVLCTTIDSCFFSRSVRNYPHLEIVNSDSIHITSTAFERSEQTVPPASPAEGRTEEDVMRDAKAANHVMTAPLIKLDNARAVSIEECHAEATYESFVGIYGHTSGVWIDGCRLDHYAITDYNPNKGYIVTVDPGSTASQDIILGPRNYRIQANHPNTTHGTLIKDPVGCVVVENIADRTSFRDAFYLTERRTVPYIGSSGHNLLRNPSLSAMFTNDVPYSVEPDPGFAFKQAAPSGCIVTQSSTGSKTKLRMRTVERLHKHEYYTFVLSGTNLSGKSTPLFIDIGGDTNDLTLILPSGSERFTITKTFKKYYTDIVDLVVYEPLNLQVHSIFVLPNLVNNIPYGEETIASSAVFTELVRSSSMILSPLPAIPAASAAHRGRIIMVEDSNGVDSLYICKQRSKGVHTWIKLG